MTNIAVLVSGGGTNLQAIIDSVADGSIRNVRICAVISNNKHAFALERARKAGIEALDLVVLAGFLCVIPPRMVEEYPNRIINIHPSLIPSFCGTGYYGLKVHEAALARGVRVSGATVHFVDQGTDTGPIILQKAVEVREDDTPKSLQLRIMQEAEWKILPEAIRLIADGRVKVDGGKVKILQAGAEK